MNMTDPARTLHRWTRAEYERMVAAGVFHPEARLELLDGEIVEMSPQGSAHATAVQLVQEALRSAFGNRRPEGDSYAERTLIGADGRIAPLAAPAAPVPVAALLP